MLLPAQREETPWGAVKRVLDSQTFRKAPKQRELLRFLAEHSIDHGDEAVHEQEIGHRVYNRLPDYSTAEDSIVRVEVRNLRKRLQEYFETEGKSDRTVIEVPKGSYRLEFTSRSNGFRYGVLVAPSIMVGLLFAVAVLLWENYHLRHPAPSVAESAQPHPIVGALFSADRETYIVLADSAWALSQDLLNRTSGLSDYLSLRGIPEDLPPVWRPLRPALERIASRQFTSSADAHIVAKITQTPGFAGDRTSVRLARNMNTRDFQEANAILLGSRRSNPWVELFEGPMNFRFEYETDTGTALVRNLAPQASESPVYRAEEGGASKTYSVVSLVDNLAKSGKVLMIAGTSLEGTEAAGEFILNAESADWLICEFDLRSGGALHNFEILLESTVVDSTPRKAEVVAHRVLGN